MDFIANMDLLSKALATFIGLAGAIFGFFRWVLPRYRAVRSDIRAGRDALVGREAVVDSITGKVLAPALPGIGVRMETNEQQLSVLTEAVATLASSTARLDDHDKRIEAQDLRIAALETGYGERVVTRLESTAAWRAVEAVANSTPPEGSEIEPDQN